VYSWFSAFYFFSFHTYDCSFIFIVEQFSFCLMFCRREVVRLIKHVKYSSQKSVSDSVCKMKEEKSLVHLYKHWSHETCGTACSSWGLASGNVMTLTL